MTGCSVSSGMFAFLLFFFSSVAEYFLLPARMGTCTGHLAPTRAARTQVWFGLVWLGSEVSLTAADDGMIWVKFSRATEMDITMIGLQNAGKTSLLRVLGGEFIFAVINISANLFPSCGRLRDALIR